ncbi:hypothetical protein D9M71_278900 [compost metagenome]
MQGQGLMQRAGQGGIGVQVHRHAAEVDLAPVDRRCAGKPQAQQRTPVGLMGQAQGLQFDGLQPQVLGGGVTAYGTLRPDGLREHFLPGGDQLAAPELCQFHLELDDRQRGNGAQVMGPQQADQAFGQLRQVVVELFAQAPHQESEALEQTLHIGIAGAGFVQVQLRRAVGKRLRKLLPGFAQVAHLGVVITQCQIVHAVNNPDK